jgi:hypothetical protein
MVAELGLLVMPTHHRIVPLADEMCQAEAELNPAAESIRCRILPLLQASETTLQIPFLLAISNQWLYSQGSDQIYLGKAS